MPISKMGQQPGDPPPRHRVPDAIPPEACYLGWQESLRNPAKFVEPEINQ